MTRSRPQRRHLATSPFPADIEPIIEEYEVGDAVVHDTYGMGRVTSVETEAVTVDFRPQVVHMRSPYPGLTKL
jgi:predicted 2-oxoglutarate/Fe(II)-dependent dioxygenase YbiX